MLPSLGIEAWQRETLQALAAEIRNIVPKPLVLIDGTSGAGKTSLAVKLADILKANVVSTDDICWRADPIHWDGEMLDGIIRPWVNGRDVVYKPSGWVKGNRPGSITADADKALIIEGNGACRATLRGHGTYSIWVETEPDIARTRVIKRDLANGENGGALESVTEFTDWWDSVVDPFLLAEAPWRYADIIVSGTMSDLVLDELWVHIPYDEKNI